MESSIELPDEIWNYIKQFVFYTKEQCEKVLNERVVLQKMKLSNALDLYDNFIFKKNGIQFLIFNNNIINMKELNIVYYKKVEQLLMRIRELIKQKSSLNNLKKINDFTFFIKKELGREVINISNFRKNRIDNIISDSIKLRQEIDDLFLKYSIYFN